MNEVKTPKKPLIYYYGIALLILMLFNFLAMPWLAKRQIKEVDYGTFMTMTENQEIGQVEIQENQILFTNKDESQVYKTGLMNDPDLVTRLHSSGAVFCKRDCGANVTFFKHPPLLGSSNRDLHWNWSDDV